MLPFALFGIIAAFLFMNLDKSDEIINKNLDENSIKKTYKFLVNDLINHHGMSQTKWNKNTRINKTNDGFGIGSNDAFIHVSDSKPIKLYVGKNKYPLNTYDTNEAINKLMDLIKSDKLNQDEKNKVTTVLNLVLKYKNYYFYKKYNHYKKLYLEKKKV